jgi:hypothetical protein
VAFTKEELEHPGKELYHLIEHVVNHLKSINPPNQLLNLQEEAHRIILSYPPYFLMRNEKDFHEYLSREAHENYKRRNERENKLGEWDDWFKACRDITEMIVENYSFGRAIRRAN